MRFMHPRVDSSRNFPPRKPSLGGALFLLPATHAVFTAAGHQASAAPWPFLPHLWIAGACLILVAVTGWVLVRVLRRRDRLRLEAAADRAASEAKSRFLAHISHELRTPLNAILGYSELLMEDFEINEETKYRSDVKKILLSARQLLSLINNLLDISKMEGGRMEMYVEAVKIEEMVQAVKSAVTPLLEHNANRLEVRRTQEMVTIQADRTKLRQILINLLGNASKFTKNGQIVLEISRQHADGSEWNLFRVIDSGIGIEEEALSFMYRDFIQGEEAMVGKFAETGLGLMVAKKFCEMMGGQLSLESKPEVGSTFTARLPAAIPARMRKDQANASTRGSATESTDQP